MSDDIPVIVCAGGASWELPLLRGLQRPELGIRVVRRCLDHGELLGTALRDRPRAVVLDGALEWLDRDLVATLKRSGVEVVAVGDLRGRAELGAVDVAADMDAAGLAQVLDAPRARATVERCDPGRPGCGAARRGLGRCGCAGTDHGRGASGDRVGASWTLHVARRRRRLGGLDRAAARAGRIAVRRAGGTPGRPRLAVAARRLPAVRPRRAGRARGAAPCRALAGGASRGVACGARRRDRDLRHGGRGRRGADRGGRGAGRGPHPVPPEPHDDHRPRSRRPRAARDGCGSDRTAARRDRPSAAGRAVRSRRNGAGHRPESHAAERAAGPGLLPLGGELGRDAAGRAAAGRAHVHPRGLGGSSPARGGAALSVVARAARLSAGVVS